MSDPVFPSIDTSTLALARAVIQLTLAGLVIWMGSRQERATGTYWWAWGLALHGLGLLFFLIRHEPIASLLVAANHLSFGISSACILIGFWHFGQRPVHRGLIVLIVSIPAISLLLWEWWMPNARWRILLTATGQVVFLVTLHRILAIAPRLEMAGVYRALRWIVASYTVLMIWAYGSLVELLPSTASVPAGYHGVLFSVGSMLFMLALAVSVLALQYSQLACQHADQARTDWLTRLLNRRGLLDALGEARHASRGTGSYAVLTIDIDHFKTINDRYGHATGDLVLRELALEMTRQAGPDDRVARIGGEEFQILLASATAESARRFAEKLCRACSDLTIETQSGVIHLTVSIGVGTPTSGQGFDDFDDVARRADEALYQAKSGGRNRVVFSGRN